MDQLFSMLWCLVGGLGQESSFWQDLSYIYEFEFVNICGKKIAAIQKQKPQQLCDNRQNSTFIDNVAMIS